MKLVTLQSGTIDLVEVQGELLLQFNASCMDALPYCHGMCCRMQHAYSAEITLADLLGGNEPRMPLIARSAMSEDGRGILVLPVKTENESECLFVDQEHMCSIHQCKPENCRNWHCSPGGVGEGLKTRAIGWRLIPTQR